MRLMLTLIFLAFNAVLEIIDSLEKYFRIKLKVLSMEAKICNPRSSVGCKMNLQSAAEN